jgi:hypothetical protein
MKVLHFIIIYFLVTSLEIRAQNFQDVTASMGLSFVNGGNYWGTGVSFFDFDEDGWDDLTVCVAGSPTRVYRNNQGTFILFKLFPNMTESKQPIWFDYDNDGYNDLLIVRRDNPHQLYKNIANTDFQDVSNILNIPFDNTVFFFGSARSFGGAVGDPNRDGYLDVSIANNGVFNGSVNSFVWNDSGTQFYADTLNSFTEYQRNSFQSVWVDLDFDGYQELFVINDFYQGNEFYKRNLNGTYVECGAQYGLDYPREAMSNSWCDFDNDGDLDVYISSTPAEYSLPSTPDPGNALMVNNSGVFVNNATAYGVNLNRWSWGALWIDVDNNGFSDLIVHERSLNLDNPNAFGEYLLLNMNGQFEQSAFSGLENIQYPYFTSVKGDFNNDGKYDIFLSPETNYPFKILSNITNTNCNFLKFRFEGLIGNRNGFGTTYKIYAGSETFTGQLLSTESYLSQNSQNVIQGLGQHAVVDSLQVHWLSGVVDNYYSLEANQIIIFHEGETQRGILTSQDYLCPNAEDSILLSLPDWQDVIWENGSTNLNRWIYASGIYYANVNNGFGNRIPLSVQIENGGDVEVLTEINDNLCFGDSVGQFTISINGEVLFSNQNLASGNYFINESLFNGCAYLDTIFIDEPEPLQIQAPDILTICPDSNWQSVFDVMGGVPPYNFLGTAPGSIMGTGNEIIQVNDANGCVDSHSLTIQSFSTPSLSIDIYPDYGNAEGSITISGTGYDSLIWIGGANTEALNLSSGNYNCQVVFGNQCSFDTLLYVPLLNKLLELQFTQPVFFMSGGELYNASSSTYKNVIFTDLSGRQCLRIDVWPSKESKNVLDFLTPGIYIIHSGLIWQKILISL